MRRYVLFLLFSLLFLSCGQHQLANAEKELEKLLDVVTAFYPGTKPLIKTAELIWSIFERGKDYFVDLPKKLSDREILDNLSSNISEVDNHVLEVGEKVDEAKKDVTQEVVKDNKILLIHVRLLEIFSRFETFLTYQSGHVDNDTLTDFYKSLIDHGHDSLTNLLYVANKLVTEADTNAELLELITDKQQSTALMCKRKQSPMHVINNLYNQITSAELKAMILVRYAYWYLHNGIIPEGTIAAYDKQVQTRLDNTISMMKYYMKNAGREFWTCNSGNMYRKLSPIFHAHVLPEQDLGEKLDDGSIQNYGIKKNCNYFRNKPFYDVCKSYYCNFIEKNIRPIQCDGYIHDCYSHKEGSDMDICLAERNSGRKYKKVKIGDEVLGEHIDCAREFKITGSLLAGFFTKRENCVCSCDDHFNDAADRYFSLKAVTSNIYQNKVITGVRIVLKNRVFQFDIEEANMTEFGNINQASVKWKNEYINPSIEQLRRDPNFHKIIWDNKTVNLDVLHSPPNTLLTGLRFGMENGALKLEIRYTPFNFASGELDLNPKNSKWISGESGDNRPEIEFNTKLPRGNSFKPDEHQRAYLKFKISSLEDDVGQNVVPFIDTEKVVGNPATLLSGAGLIYKGSPLYAGFLSMKLITYNFEPHLLENS